MNIQRVSTLPSGTGLFAAVKFSDQTIDRIEEFILEHNIPNPVPPEEYHITMVYSTIVVPWTNLKNLQETAKPTEFDFFTKPDGSSCFVLKVDSPYLTARFNQAAKLGAMSMYDQYRPHMTISYDLINKFDYMSLEVPTFDLEIKEEIHNHFKC